MAIRRHTLPTGYFMASTVSVEPELIRWAVERSGLPVQELAERFPHLDEWQNGEKQPTLKQLETFARRTMTPFGYLLLTAPPDEKLPLPDFRTKLDEAIGRASPNLLDTIDEMRRRQQWMRDRLVEQGQEELSFVGSARDPASVNALAKSIRETLGLDVDWTEQCSNWEEALRKLRDAIEGVGILVSASGVVGLNNARKLDPDEFRGFVLCDRYAPLVFVNGADTKSAQMFTLAHELAHIWLGQDGVFNLINMMPAADETERFCNQVAAEFLIPADKLTAKWPEAKRVERPFHKIAQWFKVSPLVAARRSLDLGLIGKDTFFSFYHQQQEEWKTQQAKLKEKARGGNFYATQSIRLGRRFAHAVVQAVREGHLLYRDAFQLTGLRGETFDRFVARLATDRGGRAQ
jgi:Zn-dependent peptidase ImmA (M78 family)